MTDERQLAERFRVAIRAVPVPDRPLRGRRRRPNYAGLLLGVPVTVAVLIAAFALSQLLIAYRAERAAGPDETLSPLSATLQRGEAIELVRNDSRVGRVDRIEAKLLTWDEYLKVPSALRSLPGDPHATPAATIVSVDAGAQNVWVVAVSGEVWPNGKMPERFGGSSPPSSPTPYPPYRWAMFIVDAARGQIALVATAGIAESWPPAFDKLPNHPRSP